MITVTLIFLLLTSGFLAEKYFLRSRESLLEKLGIVIFLGITVVPFININSALFNNNYISNKVTLLTVILSAIFFVILLLATRNKKCFKKTENSGISKNELLVLTLTVLVAAFSFYYYTDKEFLLSLGSYLFKGDAKCFYMQTFENVRGLIPDLNDNHAVNNSYGIISTPGNILFTATFVSIFKLYGFKTRTVCS